MSQMNLQHTWKFCECRCLKATHAAACSFLRRRQFNMIHRAASSLLLLAWVAPLQAASLRASANDQREGLSRRLTQIALSVPPISPPPVRYHHHPHAVPQMMANVLNGKTTNCSKNESLQVMALATMRVLPAIRVGSRCSTWCVCPQALPWSGGRRTRRRNRIHRNVKRQKRELGSTCSVRSAPFRCWSFYAMPS